MNDSNYPWFLLVPRRAEIKEIFDLSEDDRKQLDFETVEVSKFIKSSFNPEKNKYCFFRKYRFSISRPYYC